MHTKVGPLNRVPKIPKSVSDKCYNYISFELTETVERIIFHRLVLDVHRNELPCDLYG